MDPMTEQDQIAEYLARKGATKCAERTLSEREMYLARRATQRRLVAVDHLGREYYINGLGERIS